MAKHCTRLAVNLESMGCAAIPIRSNEKQGTLLCSKSTKLSVQWWAKFTFCKFLSSPITHKFERMNMLFQCEDTDPVRLNDELISFAKTLMARVVMLGYAEPDNTEWEQHIVHVMSCDAVWELFFFTASRSPCSVILRKVFCWKVAASSLQLASKVCCSAFLWTWSFWVTCSFRTEKYKKALIDFFLSFVRSVLF